MQKLSQSVSVLMLAAGVTFAIAGAQGTSAATLVDKGTYTLDTTTNLDWLDLVETQGYSYNQVLHNSGVSFIAQGWRYATAAELGQLFNDAGGSGTYTESTSTVGDSTWNAASLLEDLIGAGHTGDPSWQAILADPWPPATAYQQTGAFFSFNDPGFILAELRTDNGGVAPDQFGFASFLVRDNVAATPIPSSLLMLATALGTMGFAGWRRRTA